MKYEEDGWDFRHTNIKGLTHGFHPYPAMMIPQIVRRLLKTYGTSKKILFDPYCGSGTSLVEANVKDINAIGTDLNPLARLIAKTKITPIDIKELDFYLGDFNNYCIELEFAAKKSTLAAVPQFDNIDFWFSQKAQNKLALIKAYIDKIGHPSVRNFFLTAFSETVRRSSLAKKNEFKLVRIPLQQREKFDPDSFAMMLGKLSNNRAGLLDFIHAKKNGSHAEIYKFNTVHGIPNDIVGNQSVDYCHHLSAVW